MKLAVNCSINPLTALLGCQNGQLLDHGHSRDLLRSVCQELVSVFPEHYPSVDALVQEVMRVAQVTANNRCAETPASCISHKPPGVVTDSINLPIFTDVTQVLYAARHDSRQNH
jgi:hypothetical protein